MTEFIVAMMIGLWFIVIGTIGYRQGNRTDIGFVWGGIMGIIIILAYFLVIRIQ